MINPFDFTSLGWVAEGKKAEGNIKCVHHVQMHASMRAKTHKHVTCMDSAHPCPLTCKHSPDNKFESEDLHLKTLHCGERPSWDLGTFQAIGLIWVIANPP